MSTDNRLENAPDRTGLDDRKLSHAFLLLSVPFGVLLVVTVITLWVLDFDRDTAGVVLSDTIERRQEGLMETPPEHVAPLVAALQAPEGPWNDEQAAALQSLLVRTGWPSGTEAVKVVTNERLTTTPPSEWNAPERAVAIELLREFERSWFSRAPR